MEVEVTSLLHLLLDQLQPTQGGQGTEEIVAVAVALSTVVLAVAVLMEMESLAHLQAASMVVQALLTTLTALLSTGQVAVGVTLTIKGLLAVVALVAAVVVANMAVLAIWVMGVVVH